MGSLTRSLAVWRGISVRKSDFDRWAGGGDSISGQLVWNEIKEGYSLVWSHVAAYDQPLVGDIPDTAWNKGERRALLGETCASNWSKTVISRRYYFLFVFIYVFYRITIVKKHVPSADCVLEANLKIFYASHVLASLMIPYFHWSFIIYCPAYTVGTLRRLQKRHVQFATI